MSCMEKCCRADIAFQLMERMKMEGVAPNVHIFNSAISACARCNLWKKGLELFEDMEKVGVVHDVVSFNAVLDAVSSQVLLGRRLFELGIEKGFYARVSRLGTQWLELDLHFLSLGGGEIALGWWFEDCLVPYLMNTSKLAAVTSIDIVTGYGKTRMRGVRHGDDGMRKRVRAMLEFMGIVEIDQPNKGRIHIDKEALIREVQKNGGKILFDHEGYNRFKEQNTTANHTPDVIQHVRPRYSGPLPIQVDRRPPFNQSGGYDRRGSVDNPRRESNHNHRGTGKPSLDSNSSSHRVAIANEYSDRQGRHGGNDDSSQYRGRFDDHGNNRHTEQKGQYSYREREHQFSGSSHNRRSHGNSQDSDYDGRHLKDLHHGQSHHGQNHRRYDEDSHDQDFSGRRESQKQGFGETRNANQYPGSDRWSNASNIGARQVYQERQNGSDSYDAHPDNRSGGLPPRHWEGANSDAHHKDNTNRQYGTRTTHTANTSDCHPGNRYQRHHGHSAPDRPNLSQFPVPKEVDVGYDSEKRRGDHQGNAYGMQGESRSYTRGSRHANNEDGNDRRHQNQDGAGFGGRGHHKNSRNDFERWESQPNDCYSDQRVSQTPTNSSGWDANRYQGHTNNANSTSREAGEFSSQDERSSSHVQNEGLDSSVGNKRPFDCGERPAAKRRGYDIDQSKSFVMDSRGY